MIIIRCSLSADADASAGPVHFLERRGSMSALLEWRRSRSSSAASPPSEFDCAIGERELVGLIGPNGAGKDHGFNLITGVYQPTAAHPFRGARPRTSSRTHSRCGHLAHVSKHPALRAMSCLRQRPHRDARQPAHGIRDALIRGRLSVQVKPRRNEVMELLEIFGLESSREAMQSPAVRRPAPARDRARAGHAAKAALLDEPAAGMNPTEKQELMELIRFVQDKFRSRAARRARHESRHGHLRAHSRLDYGKKIAEGTPEKIRATQR
jgi:branched-chain amino acid transport system ATP-binding protein